MVVYIGTLIALICSKNLRHNVPGNYLTLSAFTLSLSIVVSGLTAYLTFKSVLISVGVLIIALISLLGAALMFPAKP